MTLAIAGAHAAAAANWRWLTGLTRTEQALYVGDPAHPLPAVLALQFGHVVVIDPADGEVSAALASLPDMTFDYVVLPGILDAWRGGTPALVRSALRLLNAEGWLAVAGNRNQPPARVIAGLRQAGCREVRRYGLAPTAALPRLVVPHTRAAALACERDRHRQEGGNYLRLVLAAAGLQSLLYRGWLVLAGR